MSEVHARVHARILELRKEKSRDAARSRRGKENYEFYELAKMLPLPPAITSQLDKASIIRLSISYLRLRDFALHGNPSWVRDGLAHNKAVKDSGLHGYAPWVREGLAHIMAAKGGPHRRRGTPMAGDPFETHQGMHILQSLDGFAFNLANDGRFLYVSETVSIYLGLSQVEMTGCSVFDYVHQQDHPELAEHLGLCLPHSSSCGVPSPGSGSDEGSSAGRPSSPTHERAYIMNPNPNKGYSRSFCVRMKSTLTKRGVHVKCSGYRVVHIQGSHRLQFSYSMNRKHPPPVMGFVAVAVALPPPTITELRIDNDTFISRLTPDFKVIYCEPIISELMDLSAEDLTSGSLYSFCHAADLAKLRASHVELLTKSQILTDYYRLMNRKGGYVWIQTCATIIYNSKSTEDQSIICINYVLSNVEAEDCVMDMRQLKQASSRLDQADGKDHAQDTQLDDGDEKTSARGGHGERARSSSSSVSDKQAPASPSDHGSLQELPALAHQASDPNPDAQDSAVDALMSMSSGQLERVDGKNSRRKMEKPRKRKKDADLGEDEGGGKVGRGADLGDLMEGGLRSMGSSPSPQAGQGARASPMAQDLSLKSPGHPLPCASPSEAAWPRGEGGDSACPGVITSSSVRELEAVMNRHLPSSSSGGDSGFKSSSSDKGFGSHPQKKSTIQWVGSSSQPSSVPENHPASSLLRSLYANRESVIRTSTRPPSYYGEGAAPSVSMLTPPGSEAHPPSFSKPSSLPAAYPPPQSYTSSPLSVSMSSAPLDSFGMTPPSSVSPQDKMQSPFNELPAYSDTGSGGCGGLLPDSLTASRLKANPYPFPSASPAMAADYGSKNYYPVHAYHPTSAAPYPDLNHNSAPLNYEQCARTVLPWYPISYSS